MITLDLIAKEHFQGTKTFPPLSTKVMLKIYVCLLVFFFRGATGTKFISFVFTVTATPCLLGSAASVRAVDCGTGRLVRGGRLPEIRTFGGARG